jgi:hypothetical protein
VTGAPEILGGRVKTLHPKIHGGILADLGDPDHVEQLVEQDIGPIDLVCINLYPFEQSVAGGAPEKEAIEKIDIGGPAMLRAAAKNFGTVVVVPSPEFYEEVLATLESGGQVPEETRRRLALAAFRRTAEYDAAISGWLGERIEGVTEGFPERRTVRYDRVSGLRYGENPHQDAAYYAEVGAEHLLSGVKKMQGREISFNNLYDLDAARTLLADLDDLGAQAAVIVKHANPCGAAVGDSLADAYRKALASDPGRSAKSSRTHVQVRNGRGFASGIRRCGGRLGVQGRDRHTSFAATDGRPDLRLARSPRGEEQRHSPRQGRGHGRCRSGPDEPGRLLGYSREESRQKSTGSRRRERRLLPFRRRRGDPGRSRHRGRHTARRLRTRR